ncbi:MAG: hypothetical protein E7290_14540 [Lachnospiraceae bacterium]|nr:hypothetical protein [Lachnospiraceae bacterium]
MVDFKYSNLFLQDSVDKQLHIEFDTDTITNEELHSENFELNENLCSEELLRFGCCEASSLKFKVSNIVIPLKDKKLKVEETLGGNTDVSFPFGEYKVYSDKPTADRRYRDIVAYDAMYDINNAEVSAWYNTILPNEDSTITMKGFRCSFLDYMGIEYEDVTLVNDDMVITKTINPTTLSGNTVMTAICEINGCFGHIGRDGKFQYIHLKEMKEGVYPSDTLYPRDDLYPSDPMNVEQIGKSYYTKATYQDYTTACINKLQIRQEEGDIGYIHGTGSNCYIVEGNFLVYGKSSEELRTIAANLYSVISKVWYRPAHVEAKGNPCLEVGDGIKLSTRYEIIYTYILQRTLKGIQALHDTYDAEGEQHQREDVNSVHKSLLQLKGKANILTRTIEETKSEIIDIEKGLSSRITQNANSITAEVKRATEAEGTLSSKITQTADSITAEVKRATEAEGTLSSKITQTADSITAEVKRATEAEGTLSSKITQTADSITAEVKRASDAESALSSSISINAEAIESKVSKDGVISSINQTAEEITIDAKKINLKGIVESDEFIGNLVVAEKLVTKYMEVENWASKGYVKAGKISSVSNKLEILYSNDIRNYGKLVTKDITMGDYKFYVTTIDGVLHVCAKYVGSELP